MKSLWSIGLFAVLLTFSACASEPEAETATEPAMADAADAGDVLSGTWTGDWGPSAEHRNPITVELALDGMNVTGTINPGDQDIMVTNGHFDPATGEVTLEAAATNFRGEEVHYTIEGQVDGNTFSGDWTHETGSGTFSVMR